MEYQLPENVYRDWDRCEMESFEPNPRQKQVIEAVKSALDAGLFYTSAVLKHASEVLAVTEEQAARGAKHVEGGHVGMDCYYARNYLQAQDRFALERRHARELGAYVGMKLGTLVFNDYKRTTAAQVVEVSLDGRHLKLTCKRGRLLATTSCSVTAVAWAMDRAVEKEARKDRFADFCRQLKRDHSTPPPASRPADTACQKPASAQPEREAVSG